MSPETKVEFISFLEYKIDPYMDEEGREWESSTFSTVSKSFQEAKDYFKRLFDGDCFKGEVIRASIEEVWTTVYEYEVPEEYRAHD